MRRMSKVAVVAVVGALVLTGCGNKTDNKDNKTGSTANADVCKTAKGNGPKVGLAYDVGGRGDQSFNDSAYAGLKKAVGDLKATCVEGEATDGEPESAREARKIDRAELERIAQRYSSPRASFDVFTGLVGPSRWPELAHDRVTEAMQVMRTRFEYVVVDTAPGFDEAVLQALDHTDELVLVATLDVPAVKNMKMAVETLDLLDLVKEHRHLVLNRADDAVGLDKRDVEGILKLPIEAAIPTDIAVASATNHGRPIVLAHPDHIVSRAVADLARAVADRPLGDSTTSAGARRRGFLRRAAR